MSASSLAVFLSRAAGFAGSIQVAVSGAEGTLERGRRSKGEMKRITPFVAAALLASCGGGGSGTTTAQLDSGVRGHVLRGPMCPVATLDNPCPDEPYATNVRVLTAGGRQVASVHSGADGHFVIRLAPGHYILMTDQGSPLDVVVKPHAFAQATVEYDTGIR